MINAVSSGTIITESVDNKTVIQLVGLISCAILLTTLQDALHSYYNQYSFYLSESLLFKSFWVLFLPLVLMQLLLIKKIGKYNAVPSKVWKIALLTLVPTALHMLLFPLVLLWLSALLFNHTYQLLQSLEYTIREDLYKYLFIYGILAYVNFTKLDGATVTKATTSEALSESGKADKIITVKDGRKSMTIQVNDILYISSANPYIAIHTIERKYLHLSSLRAIATALSADQFVRIHKSTIINIKKVSSYTSRLNGDYDIVLKNGEVVRLSRVYTHLFRARFS